MHAKPKKPRFVVRAVPATNSTEHAVGQAPPSADRTQPIYPSPKRQRAVVGFVGGAAMYASNAVPHGGAVLDHGTHPASGKARPNVVKRQSILNGPPDCRTSSGCSSRVCCPPRLSPGALLSTVTLTLLVLLAGVTASNARAQTLECATISKGGGVLPDGSIGIIGQAAVGTMSNAQFTIEVGIVACLASVEVEACPASSAPQPDVIEAKNRYVSFSAGDVGRTQAVRVTFRDLPGAHASLNGTRMWVQAPGDFCENSGQDEPPCAGETYKWAGLGCAPHFMDWSTVGVVHVSHAGVVPGGLYDIQVVDEGCGSPSESDFSPPLTLTNPKWGDCCGPFASGEWTGPDTSVDVTVDIVATLDKFRNLPGAPIKARVDLEPPTPDRLINITDITRFIDAFRGFAYPFPPGPTPCL